MAISTDTVWQLCDNRSQEVPRATIDGAKITAMVHTTAMQLVVANYAVNAGDVGNILFIDEDKAPAGYYQITEVDEPNNRWTVELLWNCRR